VKSLGEIVVALLIEVADIAAELLLEAVFAELAGILSRAFRLFRVRVRRANPVSAAVIFSMVGVCFGFLSVWLFPHHLVHPSRLHGISLLISSILTGLLMAQIGRTVRKWGRQPVLIESFGYGFVFALTMGLVRFSLVK
jgi:cytochrome bd-type quinol oxidase subunit 1